MPGPERGEEKRTASLSVRLGPVLKQRLEQEAKRDHAKSTSDFVHTLIEEALAARLSAAKSDGGTAAVPAALEERLERVVAAVSESHGLTADALARIEKVLGESPTEKPDIGKELKGLRRDIAGALINVLVQIGRVDQKVAAEAVLTAMTPKPSG